MFFLPVLIRAFESSASRAADNLTLLFRFRKLFRLYILFGGIKSRTEFSSYSFERASMLSPAFMRSPNITIAASGERGDTTPFSVERTMSAEVPFCGKGGKFRRRLFRKSAIFWRLSPRSIHLKARPQVWLRLKFRHPCKRKTVGVDYGDERNGKRRTYGQIG